MEQIISNGQIMTYEDLYKYNKDIIPYINKEHNQKDNQVCLTFHDKNPNIKIKNKNKYTNSFNFAEYHLSFVLNENLLNEYSYEISDMDYEVRIYHSIPLKPNLEAIGFSDVLKKDLTEVKNAIETKDFERIKQLNYLCDFLRFRYTTQYFKNISKRYEDLSQLLQKYNIDVPIINVSDGTEINCYLQDQLKEATKIKRKVRKILNEK